jgi:Ca2+-binding EF-hand superfamily protein
MRINKGNVLQNSFVYDNYDVNSSNRSINASELGALLHTMGHPMSEKQVAEMLSKIDKDNRCGGVFSCKQGETHCCD